MVVPQHTIQSDHAAIRVVIANMPEVLLRLIAEEVSRQPDMVVVALARTNRQLLRLVAQGVDLVILGTTAANPPSHLIRQLLANFPALRAIVLTPQNDHAEAYWIGLRSITFMLGNSFDLMERVRRLHSLDRMAVD